MYIIRFADPPLVTLRLGSPLASDDIKEGDDVYFECDVKANPNWRKLHWRHNVRYNIIYILIYTHIGVGCGSISNYYFWLHTFQSSLWQDHIIPYNASARIIRSNQSLVLQKVNRNSTGNYSCSAINQEGETVSNQISLRVKCKLD
jgi:Immunoglobulin domain